MNHGCARVSITKVFRSDIKAILQAIGRKQEDFMNDTKATIQALRQGQEDFMQGQEAFMQDTKATLQALGQGQESLALRVNNLRLDQDRLELNVTPSSVDRNSRPGSRKPGKVPYSLHCR
jgi:N-methylhydantoinase B/oxoprolinase/acetone carboxylase alpha subunit